MTATIHTRTWEDEKFALNADKTPTPISDAVQTSLGYFQASVTSVQTLAQIAGGSIPTGARLAWIQPEDGDLRFRDDGTAPTTTVGMVISQLEKYPAISDLSKVKVASQSGSAVIVNVIFYK